VPVVLPYVGGGGLEGRRYWLFGRALDAYLF
jgi:hypothetical protein